MSRRADRGLSAACALIACAWTLRVLPNLELRVVLAALTLLAVLLGPRLDLSTFAQRVVLLATTALALTLRRVMLATPAHPQSSLSGIFADLALSLVLAMSARLTLRDPEWGPQVSIALGFAALLADGQVRTGRAYGLVVLVFLLTGVLWAHANDPRRASLRAAVGARAPQWAFALLITLGGSWLGAVTLPRLHDRVMLFAGRRLRAEVASSGFNDRMTLDALDGMLISDEIALRVYGPSQDYLRGAVFNRYLTGRWMVSGDRHDRHVHTAKALARPPGWVEIRRVAARPGWYFAPMEASQWTTPRGALGVGRFGMLHPVQGDDGEVLFYRPVGIAEARIEPPGQDDLLMSRWLRARLAPFVAKWTLPGDSPARSAARLAAGLSREYTYSLSSPRSPSLDPVVDFLEVHKRGHCEYFASALALLCRAAGIPSRVVAGYRVFERAPFDGHSIVRERNAHAWVEVWVGERWRTLDATPGAAITPHRGPWRRRWQSLSDLGSMASERGGRWLAARTPTETAGAVLLGLLWITLGRAMRARRARRPKAAENPNEESALGCWVELERCLGLAGLGRARHETLESYAQRLRVRGSLGALGARVTAAIERYAGLRYGSLGDLEEITRELEELATRVPTVVREARKSTGVTHTR